MSDATAPEQIWLNLGNEETTYAESVGEFGDITWCATQQDEWDVRYVRADIAAARIAELEASVEFNRKMAIAAAAGGDDDPHDCGEDTCVCEGGREGE